MSMPQQVARLIEESKTNALDGITIAFKHAARRVAEREYAASGARFSHSQVRAALECLSEADLRLDAFSAGVKRILSAARYAPSSEEQAQLLYSFSGVTEKLLTEVSRQADTLCGASVLDRNSMVNGLAGELVRVRKKCLTEFELMLLERGNSRYPDDSKTTIYNLNGDNARVNNGSIDASTNTVNISEGQLFFKESTGTALIIAAEEKIICGTNSAFPAAKADEQRCQISVTNSSGKTIYEVKIELVDIYQSILKRQSFGSPINFPLVLTKKDDSHPGALHPGGTVAVDLLEATLGINQARESTVNVRLAHQGITAMLVLDAEFDCRLRVTAKDTVGIEADYRVKFSASTHRFTMNKI
jgi:hypothetical protein